MEKKEFKVVGKAAAKKDSLSLLLGKPSYTDDIKPQKPLVVKLLRSKYAHALIKNIRVENALKAPGIVAIYTYKDVPSERFSNAGQTYPELSPYDHLILDREVRYSGEPVAILAAEDEKSAVKAMKLIKVEYEVLPAVLDMHEALDNPVLVHAEENWHELIEIGGDQKRNLVAHEVNESGDIEAVMASSDIVLEHTYHTKAFNQAMMETFRAYSELDLYGRLHVIASTQIVFHLRRILSHALGLPQSKIRVEKPRIGGGFGAKQTAVCEMYPAFVTMKTGRPAEIIYTREEAMIAGSPRHEMEIKVKLGASKDGTIRALDVYTLSNTGAYGDHGPTTVGLSGHKSIPLYTGSLLAHRFSYDVVYTNLMPAGAYRGYGATQGIFAVESIVNELAEKLNMDPTLLREKNMVREGMVMPAYYNEKTTACALDRCMKRCKEIFDWEHKYPVRDMGNGKVRASGVAMAMQGSCISALDVGSATLILNEDGGYVLLVGSADMGTGSDTILSQMVAEMMNCPLEMVSVRGADTDFSPYDSGSYASSTTYITGMAVVKAAEKLKAQILKVASGMLKTDVENLEFDGKLIKKIGGEEKVSLPDIAYRLQAFSGENAEVTVSHTSPLSPPPFMVGMVEVELDKRTGIVKVLDYKAVVDPGTVINPALARVQAEGGIVQGIGHTLFEDVNYDRKGRPIESSLLQYRIPTRLDMGKLEVEFEESWEESGPFGAKSIGEIVINTPAPAICHALYRITGKWFRSLPVKPEDILGL